MPNDFQVSAITPRNVRLPESAAVPFEAKRLACEILRTYRSAAMATLDPSGFPYGSVTDIATDHDGTPIFLLAGLALHTRNIAADNRVSLVLANLGRGDALAKPRLTLAGRSEPAANHDMERLTFRFLQRHPKAKLYLSLPDVRIHLLRTEAVQLSAGPGRNAAEIRPADLTTDLTGAQCLLADEAHLIESLNADSVGIDRLVRSAGLTAGKWRMTGLDPEGVDLKAGDNIARIWFQARAVDVDGLMKELQALNR